MASTRKTGEIVLRRFASQSSGAQAVAPQTLPELLNSKVKEWKHAKDLIRYGPIEARWTCDEFQKLAQDHARGLLDARFRPNDLIVLSLESGRLENIVSFFGAVHANIVVHFDRSQTPSFAQLAQYGPRGIIVARSRVAALYETIPELEKTATGEPYKFAAPWDSLKMVLQTGRDPLPGLYTYEGTFTSGLGEVSSSSDPLSAIGRRQTGKSVAAVSVNAKDGSLSQFTHASFLHSASAVQQWLQLSYQDRVMLNVAHNSVSGIACGVVPCVSSGAYCIVEGPSQPQDAEADAAALALAQSESANCVVGTLPQVHRLLSSRQASQALNRRIQKVGVLLEPSHNAAELAQVKQLAQSVLQDSLQRFSVALVDESVATGPLLVSKGDATSLVAAPGVETKVSSSGTLLVKPGVSTKANVSAKEATEWIATSFTGSLASDGSFKLSKA